MKTIDLAQLADVNGGTPKSFRHYVSSAKNPTALESVNLSPGGIAIVRQFDGTTARLHLAPKGTQMH